MLFSSKPADAGFSYIEKRVLELLQFHYFLGHDLNFSDFFAIVFEK